MRSRSCTCGQILFSIRHVFHAVHNILLKIASQGWEPVSKMESLIGSPKQRSWMGWKRIRATTVCAIAISIPLVTAAAWAQNNATLSERLGTLAQTANPEHVLAILVRS